eukprot:g26470.t1
MIMISIQLTSGSFTDFGPKSVKELDADHEIVHQLEETEKASGISGLPPGVTLETATLPSSNHGTSRHGFTYTVGSLRQVHQLEDSKRDLEGMSIEAETLTFSKHGTDRLDSTYTVGPLASQSLRSAQEDYYKLMLKNEEAKAHWRTYLLHPKFLTEVLASVILLTAAVLSGYAASSAKVYGRCR